MREKQTECMCTHLLSPGREREQFLLAVSVVLVLILHDAWCIMTRHEPMHRHS